MGFNSAFKGLIFLTDFRKTLMSGFMKIRPLDEQMDKHDGNNSLFSQFLNASKRTEQLESN